MDIIIRFNTDLKFDHENRHCTVTVWLLAIGGKEFTSVYKDTDVDNLFKTVHEKIAEKHGEKVARHVMVGLNCQFSVYESCARECCKEKGIPFDLYYKASE